MRSQLAIPLIVFACTLGATLAYERARPDRPDTPPPVEPAFEMVSKAKIERLAIASAAIYGERIERARISRSGQTVATRWLRAQLDGAKVRGALPAVSDRPPGQLRALQRWANGLPADQVAVKTGKPKVLGPASASTVRVGGTYVLTLPRTTGKDLSVTVPATVTVRRAGQKWRVSGATFKLAKKGIGSMPDPVLAVSGDVAVVADQQREAFARRVAMEAKEAFGKLGTSYDDVAGDLRTTIYVVEDTGDVQRIVGQPEATSGVHPSGWTYEDGTIVLVWPKLTSRDDRERDGIVWHEVTHTVTLPLIRKAPRVVLEGLATLEESRRIVRGTTQQLDLRELREALRSGKIRLRTLLDDTDDSFASTNEKTVLLAYLAGYATVASLEEKYGHNRLLKVLARVRAGSGFPLAVERELGLERKQLESTVRVWVANHVRQQAAQG